MPEIFYKFKTSMSYDKFQLNEPINVQKLRELITAKHPFNNKNLSLELRTSEGEILSNDNDVIQFGSKVIVQRVPKKISKPQKPVAVQNEKSKDVISTKSNGVNKVVTSISDLIVWDYMRCGKCSNLMVDATKIYCCKRDFCYKCISGHLYDPDIEGSYECPLCHTMVQNHENPLTENHNLRKIITDFKKGIAAPKNFNICNDTDLSLSSNVNDSSTIKEEEYKSESPIKDQENIINSNDVILESNNSKATPSSQLLNDFFDNQIDEIKNSNVYNISPNILTQENNKKDVDLDDESIESNPITNWEPTEEEVVNEVEIEGTANETNLDDFQDNEDAIQSLNTSQPNSPQTNYPAYANNIPSTSVLNDFISSVHEISSSELPKTSSESNQLSIDNQSQPNVSYPSTNFSDNSQSKRSDKHKSRSSKRDKSSDESHKYENDFKPPIEELPFDPKIYIQFFNIATQNYPDELQQILSKPDSEKPILHNNKSSRRKRPKQDDDSRSLSDHKYSSKSKRTGSKSSPQPISTIDSRKHGKRSRMINNSNDDIRRYNDTRYNRYNNNSNYNDDHRVSSSTIRNKHFSRRSDYYGDQKSYRKSDRDRDRERERDRDEEFIEYRRNTSDRDIYDNSNNNYRDKKSKYR